MAAVACRFRVLDVGEFHKPKMPKGVSGAVALALAPDFERGEAMTGPGSPMDPQEIPVEAEVFDLVGILSAVDATAYTWDLATDHIDWESNAPLVLGVRRIAEISSGTGFQLLIAPEHVNARLNAMNVPDGERQPNGTAYKLQYRFQPGGRRGDISIWVEDHGRWWPGSDGKPARARGVIRVISDRYMEEQRLLYRRDHDELTGQLNRIRLTEALGAVISRTTRTQHPAAFMMVAINNLAVLNETFGYHVGDEVIAAIAKAINDKLRGGDSIGRYSSNKFGVILNDCGPGAMRIAAERFMKAVRGLTIRSNNIQLSATISIGGVTIPDHANSVHQAISATLQALDRAKDRRTDCFMVYEHNQTQESSRLRNVAIVDEVISALQDNRMRLVLQPLVSAKTGKPAHYECLLRMKKADGTTVSAGEFIPIAEQLGLSRLIDRRTLELCIDILKAHPAIHLSLNVSSLTSSDHEWVVALHRLTGGKAGFTKRLTIEITETAAIHDVDQTRAFVDTLKELGCKVAIDDFGAGYTSFKNLKALNADMVKIDGAFVKDLTEDASDQVFIKTMVELARTFNMETVAEWVGDEATAKFLIDAGITYLQGFHYGQPIEVSALATDAANY